MLFVTSFFIIPKEEEYVGNLNNGK